MEPRARTKCALEAHLDEFPLPNRFAKPRQSYCESCEGSRGPNWHANNKDCKIQNAKTHKIDAAKSS
jgi:hypothetical protein